MAPEFLKNLRQTGSLGQTARNVAEDLLVPPIINAVRQQYSRPTSAPAYDPLDERQSPEYMRDQRMAQNRRYDLRHRIDSEPIKDKAYYENMDMWLTDVKDAEDVDFTKDFDWTDESGETHHWRVGYKNKDGESGYRIAAVYDKDSDTDPVHGKEELKKLFNSYIKPGNYTYKIDDLGWASGGPIYGYSERSATPGYGAVPNRSYNPKSYGSNYTFKTTPSIWGMFPSGYR